MANFDVKALLSWPVFVLSLAWALITNLTDVVNNPEGMYPQRVGAVVAAHLVLFLALFVVVGALRTLSPVIQAVLAIPAIIGLALFRGFIFWLFLMRVGVDTPDMFSYRFFASGAAIGLPLLLIGMVVHRVRQYTGARANLLAEGERLVALQKSTLENRRQFAEARLERIRSLILGSLDTASSNTDEVIEAINHSVDSVLLPQINALETEPGPHIPHKIDLSRTKIDFAEVLRNFLAPQHLHGVAVGLCTVATATATIVLNNPPGNALALLALAAMGPIVLLSVLRRALLRIPPSTPTALTGAIFLLGVVAAGFATGAAGLPFTSETDQPFSLFFQAPLYITVLALLFALTSSTQVQAAEANARLAETTDRLAWEVARITTEHRQLRRALAHTLHGPLQTGLLSAVLRLQQASHEQSPSTASQIAMIRSELRQLVESLRVSDPMATNPLAAIVDKVKKTWANVVTIDVHTTESTGSTIESDPQLMNALSELIPELVFNSVKHGEATEISCEIVTTGPGTVSLTCRDNGTRPAQSSRVGLGTRLLDEYALRWTRIAEGDQTVTTLLLPVAPLPRLAPHR